MGPNEFTKGKIAQNLFDAQQMATQARTDVDRDDRVDAIDSIKLAQKHLEDAKLRLTASLAADPVQAQWGRS